jgi:GxxExxY protein
VQVELAGRWELDQLTEQIIGSAQRVHGALGPGFLERIYENSLEIELIDAGRAVKTQCGYHVRYKDRVVGTYFTDILVDDLVILEVKAIDALAAAHRAQCLNYLRASGLRVCLLLNFGASSLQVRRIVNRY